MDHVTFTDLAMSELSGAEKRAARITFYTDSASKRWCNLLKNKTVVWLVWDNSTRICMIREVCFSDLSADSRTGEVAGAGSLAPAPLQTKAS